MARLNAWYVLAPVLTAAAALVALLPGKPPVSEWYQEATQRVAVDRAVRRLDHRVREAEARVALLQQAGGRTSVTRGGLTVVYISPVTRDEATAYAESILVDTRRLFEVSEPQGHALVYLASWDSLTALGHSTGRPSWYRPGMVGQLAEPCVAIADRSVRQADKLKHHPLMNNLGGCAFILALGKPGSAVAGTGSWNASGSDPFMDYGRELDILKPYQVGRDPCAADTRRCTLIVMHLSVPVLAWVRRSFGARALGRLWKSDGDFASAVVAVTGMPLERARNAYVHSTVTVMSSPVKGWPREVGRAGISIVVSLALALALGRRRQVG
jgi:hypothetical protein